MSSNSYSNDTLFEPQYHKQPPMHPFNPDENGCVADSCGVFAIPVPIGYPQCEAPYARGAVGWKHTDWKCSTTGYFSAVLHLMLGAIQLPNAGTPLFVGRAGSEGVRATQLAYIRTIEGRATKEDKILLSQQGPNKGIRHDLMFDRNVADTIHAIVSGAMNDQIPGREEPNHERDDDLRDGVAVDLSNNRRGDYDDHRGRNGRRGRRDEEEEDEEEVMNEMDLAILNILNSTLLDQRGNPREGVDVREKIQFVITRYRRAKVLPDGTKDPVQTEDAGCIIYGFIMDPLMAIGHSFARMIEMCEEHRNARMGVSEGIGITRTTDSDMLGGGGFAKRGRGPNMRNQASTLMRHFPWLAEDEHSNNGLHRMTKEYYMEMVSFIKDDPSMVTSERRHALLAQGIEDPGTERRPNPLHPLNVFTPEWAVRVMQSYGVSARDCSLETLRTSPASNRMRDLFGGPNPFARGDPMAMTPAAMHRAADANRWYLPPNDSYRYLMQAMVWAKNGFAGLHRQYFPWIDVPPELARLTAGGGAGGKNNMVALYNGADSSRTLISANWSREMIREGAGIVSPLPSIPYDPDAITRSSVIIQISMENARVLDDIRCPVDPRNHMGAYAEYSKRMATMREACMMRARQVLTADAQINAPTKVILTWMGREMRCASTYLPMYDLNPYDPAPETFPLDPFANCMIRTSLHVHYVKHVVGPSRHWTMVFYGAQDCHSTTNVDMHFSCIFHGPSQAGKSYLVSDATESTCIPESVTTMLESSNRAFNTHDDFTGRIIFKDEVDDVIVNGKAAANDKTGLADRLKSMLTSHKATYRVLTFVDKANGRSRREAEDIESLFHATLLCCTNKKVGQGDEALASRFLNFVVTRSDCNLYEYMGMKNRLNDHDTQLKNDCVHAWRVKQALLCLVNVLIDCKVLPEPSMDAYDHINSRVMSYLGDQGINTQEIRSTSMSKRLARIYVILNAIILLYDTPGAKYMNKEFEMGQLLDLIPYLYCTQQIAFFTFTQTGEMYTHPTRSIVIQAGFAMARLPFSREKTIEDYFRADLAKEIIWRKDVRTQGESSMTFMNFNYVEIRGKYNETILPALSEHCIPKLGVNEVDTELASLAKVFVVTRQTHPVAETEYIMWQSNTLATTCPRRESQSTRIPAVVRDFANDRLYIAVEALSQLNENMLIDAIGTCMHTQMRPQNYLLGTHFSKEHPSKPGVTHYYNQLYRVLRLTPTVVKDLAVNTAFSVPDVSYVPGIINEMTSGARMHPDKAASGERYVKERKTRVNPTLDITQDLDDWAYEQHHYRVGCPGSHVNSEATQTAIFNRIREACQVLEDMHRNRANNPTGVGGEALPPLPQNPNLMIMYPEELVEEIDIGLEEQERARSSEKTRELIRLAHEREMNAYLKMTPAEQRAKKAPAPRILSKYCDHEEAYKEYKKSNEAIDGLDTPLEIMSADAFNPGESERRRKRNQRRIAALEKRNRASEFISEKFANLTSTPAAASSTTTASGSTTPPDLHQLGSSIGSDDASRDGSRKRSLSMAVATSSDRLVTRHDKRAALLTASHSESRDALGESVSRGAWADDDDENGDGEYGYENYFELQ